MSDKVLIGRELLERLADIAEIEGQPEGAQARALLAVLPQAAHKAVLSCTASELIHYGPAQELTVLTAQPQASAAQSAHHCNNCLGVQPESCMFAQSAPAGEREESCDHCEPEGVFATDGAGQFDCYACGKKAVAGEALDIVARAIDGPCRDVETVAEMSELICAELSAARWLRLAPADAIDFKVPITKVLKSFGLCVEDSEALAAEMAISLIPHLAQWAEDQLAAAPAQPAAQEPASPDAAAFQAAFLTKRVWELSAELEELRKQKPVAWGAPNSRITESLLFTELLLSTDGCQYPELLVPLYLEAKPAAQDQGFDKSSEVQRLRGLLQNAPRAVPGFAGWYAEVDAALAASIGQEV